MKPVSIAQFFQQIGQIMQDTEQIGSDMNDHYEEIVNLMKEDKEISTETLAKVHMIFEEGVAKYQKLENKVTSMMAPAKLMILFKEFQAKYKSYVKGCQMMLESVDPEKGFNKDLFTEAEALQDQKSNEIAKTMEKMMRFIR